MIDVTRTTTMLLDGLHDAGNSAAWEEFDARYRPIVTAFARRLGLSDADAADVAQETLIRFLSEYRAGKYDPQRGRLRAWLIGIARYAAANVRRGRAVKRELRGDSAMIDLGDERQLTVIWESERRAAILREAMAELRAHSRASETTIRAFELLVLRQMPVAAIAEELGVSRHDVYLAKSRMAAKLRDIVQRLERVYDEEPS